MAITKEILWLLSAIYNYNYSLSIHTYLIYFLSFHFVCWFVFGIYGPILQITPSLVVDYFGKYYKEEFF